MERLIVKTFLVGAFSLVLLSCDENGPMEGNLPDNFVGNWGVCFDSVKCESILDDGYMISADSISKVELSGFENTEYQDSECEKCAKSNFESWKYEIITMDEYSLKGDTLSFSMASGGHAAVTFLNTGKIAKVSIHLKSGGMDTVLAEHWTRLSGSFSLLN